MGSLGAQKQDAVPQSALMGSVLSMIERSGGVSALIQKLQQGGLADQVSSWIGTGENTPVSGNQILDAFGQTHVQELASEVGLAPEHVSTGLAQLLPQIIDQLTPDGTVPHNDLLAQGLGLLKNRFFG